MRRRRRRRLSFKLETKGRGAWFRVRKVVEKASVVLEVLDARIPSATRSLDLEGLVRSLNKELLLVLSKADLVPRSAVKKWIEHFKSSGYAAIPVNAKDGKDMERLKGKVKRLVGGKEAILAVVGYPNVGKSTLINGLKGRYVAETSPVPGFTRGEKLVKVDDGLFIVDTPGILPSRRLSLSELALRGFIPPEKLRNPLTPALKLLAEILKAMPRLLEETYGVKANDPYEALRLLAARRGFLVKGGELNVDEAARVVLRDWQSGKLKFYKLPEG